MSKICSGINATDWNVHICFSIFHAEYEMPAFYILHGMYVYIASAKNEDGICQFFGLFSPKLIGYYSNVLLATSKQMSD